MACFKFGVKNILIVTLFILILIMMLSGESQGRGRSGGSRGSTRWGSTRRTSGGYYPKPNTYKRKSKFGKYSLALGAGATIVGASYLISSRRHYYRHNSIPANGYIHYSAGNLVSNFNVNNNTLYTAFLLFLDTEDVLNCLIVSSMTTKQMCPKVFNRKVNSNTTFMYVEDLTSNRQTPLTLKNSIALCCNSYVRLVGSLANLIALVVLSLSCNI